MQKSTHIEVSTDGLSVKTDATHNDLIAIGLIGIIAVGLLAMWIKYKLGVKRGETE